MKFIISDTCIFIDLIEIGLINEFFDLPFEFYTTDFVVKEIVNPSHISALNEYIDFKTLEILEAAPGELYEIVRISLKHPKLSISDCSVFYFGKKNNLTILTNDKRLRQLAKDVGVHGIFWIFDCLLFNKIISKNQAIERLNELMRINQRLPVDEYLKRIKEWSR